MNMRNLNKNIPVKCFAVSAEIVIFAEKLSVWDIILM